MSATRGKINPYYLKLTVSSPVGSVTFDTPIRLVTEPDYLAACRDAVAMAKTVQGNMDINGYPCNHPDYRAAQRVLEAYGAEDIEQ